MDTDDDSASSVDDDIPLDQLLHSELPIATETEEDNNYRSENDSSIPPSEAGSSSGTADRFFFTKD